MTTNTGTLPTSYFPSGQLGLLSSSTGSGRTSFAAANTGNTNYIIYFPAETGTVALTSGVVTSLSAADASLVFNASTGAISAHLGELNDNGTLDGEGFNVGSVAKGMIIYSNGTQWTGLGIGSTGYVLTVSAGAPAWAAAAGPTAPAATVFGTSNASYAPNGGTKMAGFAALASGFGLNNVSVMTPLRSGVVTFTLTFTYELADSDEMEVTILYGTGAAPTQGAASTGTAIGHTQTFINRATPGNSYGFTTITGTVNGLSTGTAYWFDCSIYGGDPTTALLNPNLTLVEQYS